MVFRPGLDPVQERFSIDAVRADNRFGGGAARPGCSGLWLTDPGNARLWLAAAVSASKSCPLLAVTRRSTGTSAPSNLNGSIVGSVDEETRSKSYTSVPLMPVLALATDRKCSSASREACRGTDRRGLDPRPTAS